MTKKVGWGDYPRIRRAGFEFQEIPAKVWWDSLAKTGLLSHDVDGSGPPTKPLDGAVVLVPYYPPDDKLEFPGKPVLEDTGWLVQSGIVQHSVHNRVDTVVDLRNDLDGFSATQLNVFSEMDWFGECFSVLDAHGWTRCGKVTDEIRNRIIEVEGEDIVREARDRFGSGKADEDDTWECYLLEVAARHFTEPLSRLWYVANMKSLFYCHYDDLRLGYLWAEYRVKMRYELFALKHMEMTERNRENGLKGGQGDKKHERYQVLNRLARQQHFKELAFASDRDGIRVAKRMAAEYDKGADAPLFTVRGKDLSRDWYGEWLGQFRQMARGIE